jgi:basic membrane protein A
MLHRLLRLIGTLIVLVALAACSPPPARPAEGPQPAPPTAPAAAASSPVASPSPAASSSPVAAAPASCKVAQVYASPTSDKAWSWSHEQSFLGIKQALPYVDLSIRKDNVPDDNKQVVTDLLESMVQQGATVVYTTSFGYMEPTRAVAARHPEVAFFHVSGFPGPNDPPNVGYYFATIEEGRYITGQVAGLAVAPGANLGYVAAFPIPEVFRGINAFSLGVAKTNPSAKIHLRWTLTWFDLKLEKEAAEALLEAPTEAQLITMHQDSTATQLAAQAAGKLGIAYHADMNDAAPKTTLTSATWNWSVHNRPTVEAACTGRWLQGGRVSLPAEYKNWMGSFQDGTVGVAPLNLEALAGHPRLNAIRTLYDDEVAAFKSGSKSFTTVFTGPIKDNTGQVRIADQPDVGKLYDENGQWLAENVVGSPRP